MWACGDFLARSDLLIFFLINKPASAAHTFILEGPVCMWTSCDFLIFAQIL